MADTPVDFNPFEKKGDTPVDYDPFGTTRPATIKFGDEVAKPPQARQVTRPAEPTALEKARAFAYGAGTGFFGGPGELEELGAYTAPEMLGLREKGQKEKMPFGGRPTLFPTVSEVEKAFQKVGVEPPREEVGGYKTAGQVIGGFGTALPGIFRTGTKALLGTPTKTSAAYAKAAEDLGFKLSPSQVRADVPVSAYGATGWAKENQVLANELASLGTGLKTAEINSEFIGKRLKSLGSEYDKLYKGKQLAVDNSVTPALQNILMREQELGVAGVSTVKQAAQTMLDSIQSKGLVVLGDDLQRLRNALTERARSTSSRGNAHEIYDLVDVIDDAVAKKNPAFKATLDGLRPQYRNTIILEDLYRQGGIKQGNISLERLGNMLRGKRDAVRRTGQDIDDLGDLGRELGLRARWETVGRGATAGEDVLGKALGTGADIASTLTGTRSRVARAIQRYDKEDPTGIAKYLQKYRGVIGTGQAASQALKEKE